MIRRLISGLCVILLVFGLVLVPPAAWAQQAGSQEEDAVFYAGSVLLSVLLFPVKLVTCVGTQAASAVAYTTTYGVAGNYEGGTNGKQIGEVARGACAGGWVVGLEEVKRDYQ